MTDLEKVEKLREKANVSFTEAKEALDSSDGDILDALIYLEKQGKVDAPQGGGYYSGASLPAIIENPSSNNGDSDAYYDSGGDTFSDLMSRLGRFLLKLLNKGSSNFLEASSNGKHMFSCPVIAVVLLMIFFFWIVIPLFVISLFCGVRYHFRGAELGTDSVNIVMDNAADVVEDVKKSFTNAVEKEKRE